MATSHDLYEAYVNSINGDDALSDAQLVVFHRLLGNIEKIGHWPTCATPVLFEIAVQRYLEEEFNVANPSQAL